MTDRFLIPESLYPSKFGDLVSFFSVIDKLYIFLTKRKLRCSVSTLKAMYSQFVSPDAGISKSFGSPLEFTSLLLLTTVCPEGVKLTCITGDLSFEGPLSSSISEDDVELAFTGAPGVSEVQSARRLKTLHRSISRYLCMEFNRLVPGVSWKSTQKTGWPEGFDPNVITFPKIPSVELSTLKTEPFPQQKQKDIFEVASTELSIPHHVDDDDREPFDSQLQLQIQDDQQQSVDITQGAIKPPINVSLETCGGAEEVLEKLKNTTAIKYKGQIEHIERIPGRPARFCPLRDLRRSVEDIAHSLSSKSSDDQESCSHTADCNDSSHCHCSERASCVRTTSSATSSSAASSLSASTTTAPGYDDSVDYAVREGASSTAAAAYFLELQLKEAIEQRLGVTQLYSHQMLAIQNIAVGKHVVVATSTASGKSIIYNVPVVNAALKDATTTALYMFPTKVREHIASSA
jgi:hypothetical protein